MRRVELPADSPRGGVLTQGTVLVVTSNPDRTSPVKRGLFILDNILGTPAAAAAAGHPVAGGGRQGGRAAGRRPCARSLALHRSQPLCSSCHNRMDPLGLALENFNALGLWRDKERGQPIDAAGELITGEAFDDVRELKRILVERAPPRLLPLPDREAADLRPRARPGVLRRRRPSTRSSSGSRRRTAAPPPCSGHHRIGPVPEAPPIGRSGHRRPPDRTPAGRPNPTR